MADFVNHALNDESRVAHIYASVVACLTAATAVVLARIYTRVFMLKTFGLDDWAASISLLFTIACGVIVGLNATYGCGKHIWTVPPLELKQFFINFYFSIVLYNFSLLFTKASFLLQYYRVLATTRVMKQVYLGFLILIVSSNIAFSFVAIFPCKPISDFWAPPSPTRNCLPAFTIYYAQAGANIITDVIIFALPLPALWKLRINGPQKLVLLGIFSLGLFAAIISVLRLGFLTDSPDVTWDNAISSAWSIAEISIGLICASLPSLRPLVGRVLPRLASSFGKSTAMFSGGTRGGGVGSQYGIKSSQHHHHNNNNNNTSTTETNNTSRMQKKRSIYPDLDLEASVERLHYIHHTDDKVSNTSRAETFYDDSVDHHDFAMSEYGTKTEVTAGHVSNYRVSEPELVGPGSLSEGQIYISTDIYQVKS